MKKIIVLIFCFSILTNCEISPRKANAQEIKLNSNQQTTYDFYNSSYRYEYHEELRDGMKYGIWSINTNNLSYSSGYTIAVVNLTKDALEIELLKLQITDLANKNLNK